MLNSSRCKVLLSGLTASAQKVYAVVPIAAAWTHSMIQAELVRGNVSLNFNVMAGCVNTLIEAGLVIEPEKGRFRRAPIRSQSAKVTPEIPTPPPQEKAPMSLARTLPTPPVLVAPATPIDRLGVLAARVAELSATMKALAADISEAAVEAQMQMEAGAEDSQKLRQLQAILKSVA